MARQTTSTNREGRLTIKIPRVEGRTWPGRPASPILGAPAASTLKSLAVALQRAGVKPSRGYRAGMDHHDAIEWLLAAVAKASAKAG